MKPKNAREKEIIEHWYSLVPAQQFSSKEFYDHIEGTITCQKVPALRATRVEFSEGSILSDKREYLRFERERVRFDVCAAPVGVNFFFSYRFYALPAVVKPWEMIVALFLLGAAFHIASRIVGLFMGPVLLVVALGFLVWLMRNAIGMGLRDLDATLLRLPIIAPIYERYFRKDTYYREDMRIAYCSIVAGIVKQEVARVTGEKGVKLLREFTYSPVMADLYRAKETDVSSAVVAEPMNV
jgi:hypothetical protein